MGYRSKGGVEWRTTDLERIGVQRGLVSDIIGRFEKRGYQLVGLKMLKPSRELAETHYVRDVRLRKIASSADGFG